MRENHSLEKYLLDNPRRLEIAIYCQLGFSNRLIRKISHCNNWYIQTVSRRAGIKRKDYRDGLNNTSQRVLRMAHDYAQREVEAAVRKQLKG